MDSGLVYTDVEELNRHQCSSMQKLGGTKGGIGTLIRPVSLGSARPDKMTRRVVLLAIALSFTSAAELLLCSLSDAADLAPTARIGLVNPHSRLNPPSGTSAFAERLRELGYIEGHNLVLETRWADDQIERLPGLVRDVIGRRPDVLVTWGGAAALAAKNAPDTVPIVAVGIPLGTSVAENLARPGGNLTGLSLGYPNIAGKWLELLKEVVPQLSTVAVLANPGNPLNRTLNNSLEASALAQRLRLSIIEVRELKVLDSAFERARHKAHAVIVLPDSVINADRPRITAIAAKHRLPSIYSARAMVEAGGLMSYGPDFAVQWRRAAEYVDKILRGAKPGDLPIEEPTQFELVVNMRAANALRLTIPQSILLRADEVIQ